MYPRAPARTPERNRTLDRSTHPSADAPASPAEEAIAAGLTSVRPALVPAYTAALGGARAAVLTRLWRALAFEPLPWVVSRERGPGGLVLTLAGGSRLEGPLPDPCATGAYVGELRLDGRAYRQAARLVTALDVPYGKEFAAELDDSTASLALSRAGGEEGPEEDPRTLWGWEQRVVDGHPYHPNCRSRPGFSVAEQLAYAPEHRPVVELGLVAVRAEECVVTGDWPARLRDGGRLLLPVHPWQAEHVLTHERVRGGFPAHPLMSLRTLAPAPDGAGGAGEAGGTGEAGGADLLGGAHVKTALSTRLTSSVRDISVYSVETAAAVSAFAETLSERLDGRLHITRTLGAASAHSPDLAAVLREPPEVYADASAGERVLPVAALAAFPPARSAAWQAAFARLALSVCLRALELGVALEAHGQNLLVVVSATGAPVRLVYRDLADIRISPARLLRHGLPVPPLSGRLVTDDVTTLRRKLFGSLVTGALGATAGSAGAFAELLAQAAGLSPTADTEALLTGPLPTKALTLMRLSPGVPGDQWAELPNPLVL
ncbi:IucA/IucC family siderophore biosynthesis protein [Streptomyces sp. NBC_01408]|uniref:IucA/IucC family siderophore biosynthesis protein n=1 Tax=Streptomyces sp. NBC_01408 TaxID=2903855 RepID=UPI0022565ADA|nr:IucA/IucC family siderophore biosynthesis protein [Streptomyces sp. NBC_01408]MCX4695167.1 IucA/IucC family siderophore biosynthesis protein [Streptomyces sp. NBC_01408]MCX4695187.1 IucA/IucC family siderophore biosynthesis protein [Streptomyces sp. NBC_01408]